MGEPYTDEEIEEMRNDSTDYPNPDCTLLYMFLGWMGLIVALFLYALLFL